MILLEKMTVLFFMMLVGYVLYKKKVLDTGSCKAISYIVINVANPAMTIGSSFGSSGGIHGEELLFTFVLSIIVYALLIAVSFLVPRILRADRQDYGVYQLMTIFSNTGFMGFPIVAALYGNSALLYAAVFGLPFNVLIYTYGLHLIKKEEKTEGAENKLKPGQIINIGLISCFAAAVIYLNKIPMPDFIQSAVGYLSNLTAPLSMIVIGTSLAGINLGRMVRDVRLMFFILIKQLVIPLIGCGILHLFVKNEVLFGVCIVMLATPVASMTAMLAQQYEGNYELSSRYVVATTLFSVVTIPLVFSILT